MPCWGYANTGPLKSLGIGFSTMTLQIWACNAIILLGKQDIWLTASSLTITLLSVSCIISLWLFKKQKPTTKTSTANRLKLSLFALQGAALACWIFDLTTTFYAVNVTRVAVEINPLGWPLGLLGALAYYGPTLTLSYVLLFRVRENFAVYAAVPVTIVALCMAFMNLHAGTLNLQIFTETVSLVAEVGYGFLALMLTVGFFFPRLFLKQVGVEFKS